jgi:L-seryl-tRNA(Ser) seleniumtransferase
MADEVRTSPSLPAVHELIQACQRQPDLRDLRPEVVKRLARRFVEDWRVRASEAPASVERAALVEQFPDYVRRRLGPAYRPVINATGVILHTNLGRAPLPPEVVRRFQAVLTGYLNLEYDLTTGHRGHREKPLVEKLRWLLDVEDAVIVNNNAAAVLLILTALARGREVLVSRGELIEIGGKFRLPEVFAQSGAVLVEVGTTNRTRLTDYIQAATDRTVAVLRTHPSNYRIVGFTERPELADLVRWTRERGLHLWEDLGSGMMDVPELRRRLPDEPTVQEAVRAGCDLVCFSGDKIFGGPQAGIVVGRHALCEALRRHPLYRALRVDKMTLLALDVVLDLHLRTTVHERLPAVRMVTLPVERLRARARRLRALLLRALGPGEGRTVEVIPDTAYAGGGLAPVAEIPSVAVAIRSPAAHRWAEALRQADPPVIARVEEGRLICNVHTVEVRQIPVLARILADTIGRFP